MRTSGRSSLFAVGVGQAPTVLPRATTSPRERVQTGTNAACLWSVKSLQGSENSEAPRAGVNEGAVSTSWGSLVRAQYRPFTDRSPLGFAEHDDFDRCRVFDPLRMSATPASRHRRTMADLNDLTRRSSASRIARRTCASSSVEETQRA